MAASTSLRCTLIAQARVTLQDFFRQRPNQGFRQVRALIATTGPGRRILWVECRELGGYAFGAGETMFKTFLQAKLHRVRVTEAILDYEGSCGIDELLLESSGIQEFQFIDIYNVNSGERFSTYAIRAPRRSGTISLNGAAARKAMVGDLLIICAYSQYSEAELAGYRPTIVLVDDQNRPKPVALTDRAPA